MHSETNRKTAHSIVQKIRKITHDVPLITFEQMEEVIFSSLQIAEKRGEVVERRKTRTS